MQLNVGHILFSLIAILYPKYPQQSILKFERGTGVLCVHVLACAVVNVLFRKFTSGIHS